MIIKRTKGMTLVEILVAASLVFTLSTVVGEFLVRSVSSYRISNQSVMLQEQAARVMREFELSTRAATELVTANPGELEFYRYYDLTSVSPTKVRYFMNGGTFLVGKTKPVGVPPGVIYPPENEEVDFLIENVVNGSSIFNYYDDNNSELTSPFNISSVKMVRLTISLDRNPDALPNMITETTVINLRNMKRNL